MAHYFDVANHYVDVAKGATELIEFLRSQGTTPADATQGHEIKDPYAPHKIMIERIEGHALYHIVEKRWPYGHWFEHSRGKEHFGVLAEARRALQRSIAIEVERFRKAAKQMHAEHRRTTKTKGNR